MADAELLNRAKTLLGQLSATPRFAGSPEEATKAYAQTIERIARVTTASDASEDTKAKAPNLKTLIDKQFND